jgi:hypothetical protein
MTKKFGVVVGASVAIGIVALLVVGAVLAQEPTPPSSSATPQAKWGLRARMGRRGRRAGRHGRDCQAAEHDARSNLG